MITIDQCLAYAAECEEIADEEDNPPGDREALLDVARRWRALADQMVEIPYPVH
jgi:hypothetical protein